MQIENYNLLHKDRDNGQNGGGGVATYIQKQIIYEEVIDFNHLKLELIAIKIKFKSKSVNIINYYNPPYQELNGELFSIIENLDFILLGDLNSKHMMYGCSTTNKNGKDLIIIIDSTNIIVLNDKSTTSNKNFTSNNEEVLDYALCSPSSISLIKQFEVLKDWNMNSDHWPIKVQLNINEKQIKQLSKKFNDSYDFKKANWDNFKQFLPTVYPSQGMNVESMNDFITSSLLTASESSIPLQQHHGFKLSLPKEIIELIKLKHKAKNRASKLKSTPEDKSKYNKLTKLVKEEIKSYRNKQWSMFIEKVGNNPTSSKPFWQRINKLRSSKTESSTKSIPNLIHNNQNYSADDDKANLFGSILEQTFENYKDAEFDRDNKRFIGETILNLNENEFKSDLHFKDFSKSELKFEIKKLKRISSTGIDKIHNLMLINSSEGFKKLILHLINESVKQNIIPEAWKLAQVTMIPKKVVKSNNPKDYRPISVTSCLGKLTERLLRTRLYDYLNKNNLLIDQQSGFRKYRQTKDNLFHLIQKTTESFNRKKKVCAIFFDIQSAFDKIWHDGLIFKMFQMMIPLYLVRWCQNFLSNRKFTVKINEFITSVYNITAGVPQGAVLSPLLFSIFINDIPCEIKKNVKYSLLFADDLVSYFIYRDKQSNKKIEKKINTHLQEIEAWLFKWRLKMASHKCNYIVFTNNTKQVNNQLQLKLNNQFIPLSQDPTFLGIRFDKNLNLENQINYLSESCSKRLNIIKILSNKAFKLTKDTLVNIYTTLIRSMMDYSSIILARLSDERYKKLQVKQNTAIRCIFKQKFDTPTTTLHELSNLVKIKDRFHDLNERYLLSVNHLFHI